MSVHQTQQAEGEQQAVVQAAPQAERQEVPIEHWIERLASRNPSERAEAEYCVTGGNPETIQALIATLERENRKKKVRFGVGTAIGILFIVTVQAVVSMLTSGHFNVSGLAWLAGAAIGAAVAPTRLQKAVARILSQQDDIRAVGPLCEALDRQDDQTKRLAAGALSRLLPRLKAGDADLLSPEQRALLWKTLGKTSDSALARGILNAAIQAGDERAITNVERLERGRGPGRKDTSLRNTARDAIPAIRQRAAEEKVRMTLLRPSEAPDSPAEVLLRPAYGVESADASVLLRPADPEADKHG